MCVCELVRTHPCLRTPLEEVNELGRKDEEHGEHVYPVLLQTILKFADEENKVQFRAGTLSYAGAGADSRACHFFVALEPSGARLGNAKHETTIGHVEEVAVFEQVAANFQAAGCASAFPERPP